MWHSRPRLCSTEGRKHFRLTAEHDSTELVEVSRGRLCHTEIDRMITTHSILASSDDGIFRLIVTVVVLIVWGITAMASTIKKAQAEARKKQARMPLAPGAPSTVMRAAPLPPLVPQTSMALPPLPTLARKPSKPRAAIAKSVPKAIPLAKPAALVTSAGVTPPVVSSVVQDAIPALLRPTTVRAQFILAEVLQPPLALRTRRNF